MSEGRQHISLASQIEEAETAFRLRESEIVRLVNRGAMRQSVGAMHVARLDAARQTLRWLERNEAAIKAKVEGAPS